MVTLEAFTLFADFLAAHGYFPETEAARKLKMARLLGEGGLDEEARAALLEAVPSLGRALAIENRLPEPAGADQALLPPLSTCWKDALAPLRQFTADTAAPWKPLAESLAAL